jgi:hypothetical protein
MGRKASIQRRKAREDEKLACKKNKKGAKHDILPEKPEIPEPETSPGAPIYNPTKHDVLLGRGAPYNKHNGDTPWHAMIYFANQVYNCLDEEGKGTGNKRKLAEAVNLRWVQQLNPPGRFLEKGTKDEHWYEVLDGKKIREKAMNALRQRREKMEFEIDIAPTEEQMQFLQPFIAMMPSKDSMVPEPAVNQLPSTLNRDLMAAQQLGAGFSGMPPPGMFLHTGMFHQERGHGVSNGVGISH